MPKINAKMKPEEFNKTFVLFHNQMLFLRLINSGRAYSGAFRSDYVKKAFDTAYNILAHAVASKDPDLFNRIYSETHELVKGPYVTPEMEKIRDDFYTNIQQLTQIIAEMAIGGRVR